MTQRHLTTGDALPPMKDGVLYLFTMKFCPYCDRVKLVMTAKGIKWEPIYCNTVKKPEFLLERNPKGQVPVLQIDDKVVYDSEVIINLLEELYPDVPMYPKDPFAKAKDQSVILNFCRTVNPMYYKFLQAQRKDTFHEEAFNILKQKFFEHADELKSRGTVFFAGNDAPGIVDLFCWPWFERMQIFEESEKFLKSNPVLSKYIEDMHKSEIIKEVCFPISKYREFFVTFKTEDPVYDF